MSNGHKASTDNWAIGVQQMDIVSRAIVDAVVPASVAADDVKVSLSLKLGELLGRQPTFQEAKTTSFTTGLS
jgi:hypothetical protein